MRKSVDVFIVADNTFRRQNRKDNAVIKTTAVKGRTYYTTEDGRRFLIEDCDDANGNPRHRQYSEYSGDYILYETEEHAQQYLQREEYLSVIRSTHIDRLNLNALRGIVSAIVDQSAK